jgi:hypothetical protein
MVLIIDRQYTWEDVYNTMTDTSHQENYKDIENKLTSM